jgi:hypothetical protein
MENGNDAIDINGFSAEGDTDAAAVRPGRVCAAGSAHCVLPPSVCEAAPDGIMDA